MQVCTRIQDIHMCRNSVEAKMDKPHIRQWEDGQTDWDTPTRRTAYSKENEPNATMGNRD